MLVIIAYDLEQSQGRDNSTIENKIKSFGPWARVRDSVWVVETTEAGPHELSDALRAVGLPGDRFFAAKLSNPQNWWSRNLPADVLAWFKDNARRW